MSKETFDIAIISAGVVGAAIARKLSSYNLKIALAVLGIIAAAFSVEEMKTVEQLYMNGKNNKAVGNKMCNRSRMEV